MTDAREWIAAATERAQEDAPPYLVGIPEDMACEPMSGDEWVEYGFDAGVLWGAWEARRKMPAVDALTAVLNLHARRPYDTIRDGVSFGQTDYPDLCSACRAPTTYPCPTITAITNALEDA